MVNFTTGTRPFCGSYPSNPASRRGQDPHPAEAQTLRGPGCTLQKPPSTPATVRLSCVDRHLQAERPSPLVNFTAGTLASVAATMATQPADVVRTHIQLKLSQPLPPGTRPLGGFRTVQALVRSQGPGVLLAGALPRVSSHPK